MQAPLALRQPADKKTKAPVPKCEFNEKHLSTKLLIEKLAHQQGKEQRETYPLSNFQNNK